MEQLDIYTQMHAPPQRGDLFTKGEVTLKFHCVRPLWTEQGNQEVLVFSNRKTGASQAYEPERFEKMVVDREIKRKVDK